MSTNQEMLDRIAKLSSAIQQQRHIANNSYSHTRGGFMPRGRGRGNMSLNNRSNMSLNNRSNMSLNNRSNMTLNNRSNMTLNNRSNMSLNNTSSHYTNKIYTRPPPTKINTHAPYPPKTSQHRTWVLDKKNNSTTTHHVDPITGKKQVSINGVDFIVKGKKLIRKDLDNDAHTHVPKVLVRRTMKRQRDKHSLIKRTLHQRNGNLVYTREPEGYVRHGPSSLVLKDTLRPKKKRYCGFYTRYGKCPKATQCPFVHDPTRRAICPRFLQNKCTKPICRLSHTPNPHIMPHCVHFQKGRCASENCIFPHVCVSQDAPVCRAFAMEGYCPKGLDCDEKHVHVCPEFAETGQCSNANCRLPHVAKSKKQSGIIRLGSWVNTAYFHAQRLAKKEKMQQQQQQPTITKEEKREKEEQDGFVRLFDDSDEDDGWSQYERNDDQKTLRFNEEDSSEEEEFQDASSSLDKDMSSEEEVYEEVSDTEEEEQMMH